MQRLVVPFVVLLASCTGVVSGSSTLGDNDGHVVVLEGQALEHELSTSPVREVDEPFLRIGMLWDADRPGAIEISVSEDGATWSAWAPPSVHHVELERDASFTGQLASFDVPARFYRLRAGPGRATFARIELLATPLSAELEDGQDGVGSQRSQLIGSVEVNSRADWGARNTRCTAGLGNAYRMAIHHTETPTVDSMSPQARLRQIQSYHMDVRGWCDIGYHYLISRDGRVWQGRPGHLRGAHAGAGNNTGNVGISVMGSHDSTPVTQTQLNNIAALVAGVAQQHNIELNRNRIKGHREYKPTTCPGDALFARLDDIVDLAAGVDTDPVPDPSECSTDPLATDGPWTCTGLTGETTNLERSYYSTSFGCWVDDEGNAHGDPGDNCIPACSLASIGCDGMTGPDCERSLNWFAAGSDRWGCGTQIAVTNPDNGRTAVLRVIDRGPNCSIENLVDHWVVDMSYRASYYLFGEPTAATERAAVIVDVVSPDTPLGPFSGDVCEATDPGDDPVVPPGSVSVLGVLYAGSDTSDRIAGATVTLDGRTTTTGANGLWQFDNVPEGDYTVQASAAGYQTRSISRTTYAAESWSSFGLSVAAAPTGTAVLQGVVYRTSNSSNRIANATVTLSTGHTATADANGFYRIYELPAGPVTITASAPGYPTSSVSRELVDGDTEWGSVRLE